MNADLEKGKFSGAGVSVPVSRITAERRQGNDAPAHNEEEDHVRLSMIDSNHRRRSPGRRISEGSPRSLRRRGTARTVNFDGSVRYGNDEAQTGNALLYLRFLVTPQLIKVVRRGRDSK